MIIGCSFDSAAANAKFKQSSKFDYPLWSDLGRELALQYGAAQSAKQLFADRVTVVLNDKAEWVLYYGPGATNWDPAGHPKTVLDDLKLLMAD